MNIAIIGSTGFLGSNLVKELPTKQFSVTSFDRKAIDLSSFNPEQTKMLLAKNAFSFGIVAAAVTNIDQCQDDQNKSFAINVINTIRILTIFKELNIIPIFFSSDYVFPGIKPSYTESDIVDPQTEYGKQKVQVENFIQINFDRYLIFRTSKIMSRKANSKNLIFGIANAAVKGEKILAFSDQWINPVFVEDIAEVAARAMRSNLSGIYHLGTRTIFSRLTFAQAVAKILDLDPSLVTPGLMNEVKFKQRRSSYSVLDSSLIEKELDFKFTELTDGLNKNSF